MAPGAAGGDTGEGATGGSAPIGDGGTARVPVLLVEDDPGDAFLVRELLDEAGAPVELVTVPTLGEALARHDRRFTCVLLDLNLPDADGLDSIDAVRRHHPAAAVIVLTGLADAARGDAAVAAGAQDYLVKGEVEGPLLARSIRYAVERKRSDESERQLLESAVREEENARLELGLLPVPILVDPGLSAVSRYRPGRHQALLGGDFFDAVETDDGALHLMIGDVCGHGPDQAALGVRLRIAWRTLVLAGQPPDQILPTLDVVLETERRDDEVFVTLCQLEVAPDRRRALLHLAGHPAPLLVCGARATQIDASLRGQPLGMFEGVRWRGQPLELPTAWSLVLYTDGLIEGRVGGETDRLGPDRLVDLLNAGLADRGQEGRPAPDLTALLDETVAEVERLNGGALVDDVAVLMVTRSPGVDGGA